MPVEKSRGTGMSVILDRGNSEVTLKGKTSFVKYEFALLADILYKAGGLWVSGPELSKYDGLFPQPRPGRTPPKKRRPDRVFKRAKKIPALALYLDLDRRKGYRFKVELLD